MNNLVQLFQVYYNWLYSTNGSRYILDNNFEVLKDLDFCPNEMTSYLLSNYLPNSSELVAEMNKDQLVIEPQHIRNFLNRVTDRFCNIKGTPASIQYFCNPLNGASTTRIEVFDGSNYIVTLFFQDTTAINIEYLEEYMNEHVIPIGVNIQFAVSATNDDFTNASDTTYRSSETQGSDYNPVDVPITVLQNANIEDFSQWEEATFGEGAYDGTGTGEEIAIIGNYFPYTLDDTTSIQATAGCSGSTAHFGITGGATYNLANMLTYAFPDWSDAVTIAGSSFGILNILDVAFLNAASGNTSPNDGRESNSSCPIGGYP